MAVLWTGAGALVGAACLWLGLSHPPAADVTPAERVLARRAFDFPESHDGRRVAEVILEVRGTSAGASFTATAAATGAWIQAEPGWRGVAGSNAITAREIGALFERGALAVETALASGEVRGGTVRLADAAPALRRALPQGRLETLPAPGASAVVFDAGPLPEGRHVVRLLAEGRVRLEVGVSAGTARATILAIRAPADLEERP
jgi:hypothetical protein